MNEFFISKVNNLRKKIPSVDSDPLRYLKDAMSDRSCSFKLQPVELAQVKKLIKGLKNSTATGVDYIDTSTVKLGCDVLAPALMHIINLSITSSTFPETWKWHKVIPLLKNSDCDKLLPKSYRPVALLPVLSKVLEKVVFGQLVEYMEKNQLVHPNLHGSRPGHSTATALTQLYDNWVEEIEKGNMVGVLLCDQSAAFDLCDHYLLKEKLRLMGVDVSTVEWISSYLSDRKQSCFVDGNLSPKLNIPQCGVPQGSIGGPILWLLFTCDQPDVIHNHSIDRKAPDRGCSTGDGECGLLVGYVDDGAYSYAHADPTVLSNVLSEKFERQVDWMNGNKLVINPDKTHLMVLDKKKYSNRLNVSVRAGGYVIKPSGTERLLGGYLHESLQWRVHIRDHKTSLVNQLMGRINGLKKLCVHAKFQTRLMVANGLVMSKLSYLIILWGGAQQYLVKTLQVQQLMAARIVCGVGSWRLSRRQLLTKVGWLSVKQLIFYHTVLQAQKTLSTGCPLSIYQSLSVEFPRETRSATSGQIRQIGRCTASFAYRATQYYNSVPCEVRSGSLSSVKSKLKKWIKANLPID